MSAGTNENDIVEEAPQSDTVDAPAAVEDEILDAELERLVPGPGEPLSLYDGTQVVVRPLKLKELFAAFKVITRGAAMSIGAMGGALMDQPREQMMEAMLALFLNAFPEADQEFCELLRQLVDPVVPEGGWADRDEAIAAETHLDRLLLIDPEIDDAIDILTCVIVNEAEDIQRLGKKVASAVKMFMKVQPKGLKK